MDKQQIKTYLKKTWNFIWHSNSIWSWIANIILAFVIIKFIVYPLLGLILATSHPIVAVVSESMEHDGSFDQWWQDQSDWYRDYNISREQFEEFPYVNGFNKGDIMILRGQDPENIELGEILVFDSEKPNPIIHRVVQKWQADGQWRFQTKGDHNKDSIAGSSVGETDISQERVIGKAVVRVPFLGWIKIIFVDYIVRPLVELIHLMRG